MQTSNISFKGSIKIKGNMDDVADLYDECKKIPQLNATDSVEMHMTKCPFTQEPIFIFATGAKDAPALTNYKQNLTNFVANKKGKIRFMPPEKLKRRIENLKEVFFQRNFSKYIDNLPEKTFDVKEVLKAIKEGRFDVLNLKFK